MLAPSTTYVLPSNPTAPTNPHGQEGRKSPTFRPDIEGLRGIAVLLVVAFHAQISLWHGGFLGVDVFFVLSGYLITGLLWRDLETIGKLDLMGFYARRARRLLPASALVVAFTVVTGTLLLSPLEQIRYSKTAVATTLYVSNVVRPPGLKLLRAGNRHKSSSPHLVLGCGRAVLSSMARSGVDRF